MPEYKKKHINRLRGAPKPIKRKNHFADMPDDIVMSPSGKAKKSAEPKSALKVVKGKKLEQQRRLKIFAGAVAVILIVCTVLELLLPVGIIENIENASSLIGTGSYPSDLDSNDTVCTVSRGAYYYVLTDTILNAFSNGGKKIYSHTHGYEHPVLKTSKTRALLFEQGGTSAVIYNLRAQKLTLKTKKNIINAAISDSGTYAVVTHSDKYASDVSVYDKTGKLIYEWFSSEDTVNNVAVSPSGKKIAVSTFNTGKGVYSSKINILNFKSATPEYSESFDGTLVYQLDTTHTSGFSVLTSNSFEFIGWSKYNKNEYKNDYSLSVFRAGSGGMAAVFNRNCDRTDNRIAVFNSSGKLKSEFAYKGIISDIRISGGHIYCISDTSVFILDEKGSVLKKAECGFGAVGISVIGTNMVAVVTDNQIEKVKLE